MPQNNKDITEKRLEGLNDVFSDIVNGLLFKGAPLMKPDELIPVTPRTIYKVGGEIHEQERDTAKLWKHGCICIAILGLENQSEIDHDMPLRVISYDGAAYRAELLDDSKKDNTDDCRESKQKSRIRYPVVTLVLYFGYEKRWTKPLSLKECFDIPAEMDEFVSDYRINVFNIAWLTDEEIVRFDSDFRTVAEFFQQKRLNKDFAPTRDRVDHVYEMLDLLKAVSGSAEFSEEYIGRHRDERSTVKMESFFEYMNRKGFEKGKLEGELKGKIEGKREGESRLARLISLLLKSGKSDDIAAVAEDETRRQELYRQYGIA